ncbi:hypothetical protein ACLOJK_002509 [Asimina triloba]
MELQFRLTEVEISSRESSNTPYADCRESPPSHPIRKRTKERKKPRSFTSQCPPNKVNTQTAAPQSRQQRSYKTEFLKSDKQGKDRDNSKNEEKDGLSDKRSNVHTPHIKPQLRSFKIKDSEHGKQLEKNYEGRAEDRALQNPILSTSLPTKIQLALDPLCLSLCVSTPAVIIIPIIIIIPADIPRNSATIAIRKRLKWTRGRNQDSLKVHVSNEGVFEE